MQLQIVFTTWKVSEYGVYSGPYYPVFGLNTKIYSLNLRIQSEYRKIQTRKNSVFGHFSRSDYHVICFLEILRMESQFSTSLPDSHSRKAICELINREVTDQPICSQTFKVFLKKTWVWFFPSTSQCLQSVMKTSIKERFAKNS